MEVLVTPDEMRSWSRARSADGLSIGFVPTMGALHDGHLALLDRARQDNDVVVLSIFVNPAQFNVAADFDSYPRTPERDFAIAESASVDAVYTPSVEIMYPAGHSVTVEPGTASLPMEGAGRPGHFRGVATIVAKLFHAVEPTRAYFGRKDFQQLAVIQQMVHDLDFGLEIVGVDTVREPDGLALSSRNVRLSPVHRAQASVVKKALDAMNDAYLSDQCDVDVLRGIGLEVLAHAPDCSIEYLEIVDIKTLSPLTTVGTGAVVCVAAWFGDVRLIDNHVLQKS